MRPSAIFPLNMGTERTRTDVLPAGVTLGVWARLLELLVADVDYEWQMIDASPIKVHPHANGAKGGNQDMGLTERGLTPSSTSP